MKTQLQVCKLLQEKGALGTSAGSSWGSREKWGEELWLGEPLAGDFCLQAGQKWAREPHRTLAWSRHSPWGLPYSDPCPSHGPLQPGSHPGVAAGLVSGCHIRCGSVGTRSSGAGRRRCSLLAASSATAPLGSHGVRIHTFPIHTATTSLERAASSCSLLLLAYFLGYVKARLTEPGASARAAELVRVPAGSGG